MKKSSSVKISRAKVRQRNRPRASRLQKALSHPFIFLCALAIGGATRSGKSGDTVYNKNGVVRAYAVPGSVPSGAQTTVRSLFASVASAWKSLTQAQQDAWIAYGGSLTTQFNRLGVMIRLSGLTAYVRLKQIAETIGRFAVTVTVGDLPPSGTNVVLPDTTQLSEAVPDGVAGTFTCTNFTGSDAVPAGLCCLIEATPPMSGGRNKFPRSFFRAVAVVDAAGDLAADYTSNYEAIYGTAPAAGQKCAARFTFIRKTGGTPSVPVIGSALYA